jgi:hypothetical protein
LVTVAVLAASEEETWTLLDETTDPLKVELVLRVEWPDAFTVSVTVLSSVWGAVKVHCAVPPGGIGAGEPGQSTLVAVPLRPVIPAAQAAKTRVIPSALSKLSS